MTPAAPGRASEPGAPAFQLEFAGFFELEYDRLFRFLDRLSGDPELAADLAQDAFLRLLKRGSFPDSPSAWLVTVALNLYRNSQSKRSRRTRLLSFVRARKAHSDPGPSPETAALSEVTSGRVRGALSAMAERDQRLLLLQAEGFSYQDMATVLAINPTSIGTLLGRAKKRFRKAYSEDPHAS